MRIPTKIVIKGKIWSIGYKWRLHDEEHGDCTGLVDWTEATIWLDRAASREDKDQALLHEIIHIILDEYNLHETGGIGSTFAEEAVCAGVARTLLEMFNIKFKEEHLNVSRRAKQSRK